ncbi:MAG: 4-hydroxy-tetrahydrodipicolinate reductase [Acidobacteria bacterium]|nr:4-hydroxy-tetrahydrodipicolinate reductase [Acidobacteriota bacterium]
MKILLLGMGKTGSLVAEVARSRGHEVAALRSAENRHAAALSPKRLEGIDAVMDFTTPQCVVENILACLSAGSNIVVGTTGWYAELPTVRREVERVQTGLVFSSNFSLGVNLFFDLVKASVPALKHRYFPHIYERHHAHKKDAPSGTAAIIQRLLEQTAGDEIEITSFREGEVVGMHELVLDSADDTIYLCHDAKSRRGFAEGAVRAAEWLKGKKGVYDFKDIWREI